MKTKIYVLCELDGEIRYIGKTVKSLAIRLSAHLTDARVGKKNHRCNWIRSVLSKGYLPSIQLIGEVDGDGVQEEVAWISYGKNEGWRLVNATDGGEGVAGHRHSKEAILKMSEWHKGRVMSEDSRRKMVAAISGEKNWGYGRHLSDETKSKISKSLSGDRSPWKGRRHSVETREKMSLSAIGKTFSDEHRKKLSEAHKGRPTWIKGKHHSEETRRKLSRLRTGAKNPHRGVPRSEETRRKLSEISKAYWAKRRLNYGQGN